MLSERQIEAVEELIIDIGDSCIASLTRERPDNVNSQELSHEGLFLTVSEEADDRLRGGLLAILPNSLFLSKNTYEKNTQSLDNLKQDEQSVWVVDPLNGDSNVSFDVGGLGTTISLVRDGEIWFSCLYDVCSKTLIDLNAFGTTVRKNGNVLAASKDYNYPLKGQFDTQLLEFSKIRGIANNTVDFRIVDKYHSPITSFYKILTGELDFLIYKNIDFWDHFAGIRLVQAHGGVAGTWAGGDFSVWDLDRGLVIARDPDIYFRVVACLNKP